MNTVAQLSPSLNTRQALPVLYMEGGESSSMSSIAQFLDTQQISTLEFAPWIDAFPYKPIVRFSIAYSQTSIYLKFFVEERTVRAATTDINGPVWEDTCVEFFLSFDGGHYYNLEFNCTGTALVGYGSSKADRKLLPAQLIQTIDTYCLIQNKPGNENRYWELTLSIPLTLFIYTPMEMLKGKQYLANFYKCGDLLPEPHFICWKNIEYPEPNFHLLKCFGVLDFK